MNELLNLPKFSLTEMSSAVIVFNILLTFVLSLFIAFTYKKTHRGISYSQSYIISLVMLSVLAAIAMMILGNNLTRALGVLGVFTLIRFRTIVKDTKDATFLFFALAIGMAIGTNNYAIALLATVLMSAILFFLDRTGFGSMIGTGYILTVIADKKFNNDKLLEISKRFLNAINLLQVKLEESGESAYHYKVRFNQTDKYQEFMDEIKQVGGVKIVDLVSGRDTLEY